MPKSRCFYDIQIVYPSGFRMRHTSRKTFEHTPETIAAGLDKIAAMIRESLTNKAAQAEQAAQAAGAYKP